MAGNDRRLVVNVGGIRYTTSVTTLRSEQNSFFTGMLGGDWAETDEQELFIDRNGELFKHVPRFLRASQEGRLQVVRSLTRTERALLLEEAKFFQLDHLSTLLQAENDAICLKTIVLNTPDDSPSFVELSKLLAKDWQILQVVGYGRCLQLQVLLVSSKL